MSNKVDTRIRMAEPSLTIQSAKDECDINLIVERAKRGADVSNLVRGNPMFGDFTDLPDLRQALLIVRNAEQAFMSLDAKIRERFSNDPALMLDFLSDVKNRDEAIRLGMIDAPAEPASVVAETTPLGDVGPVPRVSAVDKRSVKGDAAAKAEARKAADLGLDV